MMLLGSYLLRRVFSTSYGKGTIALGMSDGRKTTIKDLGRFSPKMV